MSSSTQTQVMEILDGSPKHSASRYVEWIITLVVLVNCTAVILDSVPEIHADYKDFFHELEFWSVMFFTLEYVSRVWSLGAKYGPDEGGSWKGRFQYMLSPFGLVDFFATMPYYLHIFFPYLDLRILRVLRLLRILKLSKYNTALQDLFHAVYSERKAFGSAVFLLTIATVVSASLMHFAEGHQQPEFFGTIPHAIYWAIVTITSGYGNVDPVTFFGTILVVFTQILSIALAAILTGVVATAYTAQVERREAMYEMEVRAILADGVVTEEEQRHLKNLQAKFGMSDDQVASIAEQVEHEKQVADANKSR